MTSQPFEGRQILITGAGSGIGRATARKLYSLGAELILVGRRLDKLKETLPKAQAVSLDHSDESAVMKFAKQCGPLDGLFLNAGSYESGNVEKGDPTIFRRMIQQNLVGPWNMTHYLGSHLTEGSSVVLTGSNSGIRAIPLSAGYGVAKAGVHMLAQYLSQEWGSRQIRVNAIAPGPVATDMLLDRIKEALEPEQRLNDLKKVNPLNRIGQAEEIASLVVYLLGPESQWLSGAVIPFDGGAGAVHPN